MSTPKRFVSWAAVSSPGQAQPDKISLEDQKITNLEHIQRHGGVLIEHLEVPGESRSIVLFEEAARRMSAYARLQELIDARAFDVLICRDRSRLGRKASLSMAVVELCAEAGILCYETESPPRNLELSTSHDTQLIGAIKSVGAQQEVEKLKFYNEMGMIGRVKRGLFPNGTPWGWLERWEPSNNGKPTVHYDVDPQAAACLRIILELYLERGLGLQAIADELNRLGYPAPGGNHWYKTSIYYLFDRIWRYAGVTEINRKGKSRRVHTRARGQFPAILTDEQVHAVQAEQKRRHSARRSVGSLHRFSQCVICEQCGRRRIASWSSYTHRNGKKYVREVYRCFAGHSANTIAATKVAAAVRAAVEYAQNPEHRARLLQEMPDTSGQLQAQIEEAGALLHDIEVTIEKADDRYFAGKLPVGRYERQLAKLEAQKAELVKHLQSLRFQLQTEEHQSRRGVRLDEVAGQGLAMLEESDVVRANVWMRAHFQIAVKTDGSLVVTYL